MTETADVIVIGGGIAGAGVGAMLADEARVLVLESEDRPGYHSTGRSAAIFIESYGNDTIRAFNRASRSYLSAPPLEELDHSLLSDRGILYLSSGDEIGDAELDQLLADDPNVVEVSTEEALNRVSILNPTHVHRAAYEESAQDIDVDALHQAWLKRLRRLGGRIVCSAPVSRLHQADGVWNIEAGSHHYQAPVIVNAAGAWADTVAEMAGIPNCGLQPLRRSMAVLPAPDGVSVSDWPLFGDSSESWYAKPESGKLLVSPADADPVDPHDAFVDDMVLAEGLHRFEQAVTCPVTRVERSWAGLRAFSPDKTPVVGYAAEQPGFFWLAGQGGYGIQTAPALSTFAASLILHQTPKIADAQNLMEAMSPARFT